jgi:hypothetical protein
MKDKKEIIQEKLIELEKMYDKDFNITKIKRLTGEIKTEVDNLELETHDISGKVDEIINHLPSNYASHVISISAFLTPLLVLVKTG